MSVQEQLADAVQRNVQARTEVVVETAVSATSRAAAPCASRSYSSKYVWYVIFLLSVVNVFNYIDRMALAVLLPSVKVDLNLSDGQLGLLVGLAFALFYAICGIPIARWADRGIRRNIVALALAVWSVMTALSGAAQNFVQLFLARVGVGAGEAGCVPPAQSIICDYIPLKRRAGVLAFHNFGLVAGTMVGMALAGTLNEIIGWRWTLVALGVPGVGLALLVRLTLHEPERGRFDAVTDQHSTASLRETIAALWHCRTYRLLMVFTVINGFVQYGLNQWWPSFYSRSFDLSLASVGLYLGGAIGIGSGLGLLIGGVASNRAAQRDVNLPLCIGACATALALPAALGSLFVSSPVHSILLVGLTALLWSVTTGPFLASLYSVTQPRMRATAGAIMIFFTSVLGFGLGPFAVGVLSDLLTPSLGSQALRYALIAPMCLLPMAAVALYFSTRVLVQDLRAAGIAIEKRPTKTVSVEVAAAD